MEGVEQLPRVTTDAAVVAATVRGHVLQFELADGAVATLPLDDDDSLSIYARLMTEGVMPGKDDPTPLAVDVAAPIPLELVGSEAFALLQEWLQHFWHRLSHPADARDPASEALWSAGWIERASARVSLLCQTLSAATFLGVGFNGAVGARLGQAIADKVVMQRTAAGVVAFFARSDEERAAEAALTARMQALGVDLEVAPLPFEEAGRLRQAFLTASLQPRSTLSSLTDDLLAEVCLMIVVGPRTEDELRAAVEVGGRVHICAPIRLTRSALEIATNVQLTAEPSCSLDAISLDLGNGKNAAIRVKPGAGKLAIELTGLLITGSVVVERNAIVSATECEVRHGGWQVGMIHPSSRVVAGLLPGAPEVIELGHHGAPPVEAVMRLERCSSTFAYQEGIYVGAGCEFTMNGGSIARAGTDGIRVEGEGATATLTDVKVEDSGCTGIRASGCIPQPVGIAGAAAALVTAVTVVVTCVGVDVVNSGFFDQRERHDEPEGYGENFYEMPGARIDGVDTVYRGL
jgi:hypothetical protein